ncbi:MAG: twin-arginine translocation signal domain-containing protein [Acidobacteriia bacterium]|nr:twin-arginine translocation signal domain-containing protein [Terriglobia bacterium]
MHRRSFLKAGSAIAVATGLGTGSLCGHVPTHNFDKYNFGPGPTVSDRLYQGPFSADDYPSWNVVTALTSSQEIVPNYGTGLITYVCDEVGPGKKDGETLAVSIDRGRS